MQYNAKASESVTYKNFSLQDARLSTSQQHTKPIAEENVNMQRNPSYSAVGNPQVKSEVGDNANMEEDQYFNVQSQQHTKPTAEDNVNMQRNPSYSAASNPQVKPEVDDNEEDQYFNVQSQQHTKPIAKDNVNMQRNPSYSAVGNPQVKPKAVDNANMEEDLYFNVQ